MKQIAVSSFNVFSSLRWTDCAVDFCALLPLPSLAMGDDGDVSLPSDDEGMPLQHLLGVSVP